jgi:hypothetical protein
VVGGQSTPPGLEAVLNDSARLVEALESARRTRRFLLLGVLVFLVATGAMFYRLISRISSQENIQEITRLAQARLAENSDQYMNEVRQLIDASTPVLTDAFYKRAKDDLPIFVRSIGDQLANNLMDQLEKRLSNHYKTILDRHEAILQEELPETKDPELRRRLETNLGVAFDRLVKKYYADEINAQLTTLVDTWEKFPEAPPPDSGTTLGDQLVGNLFELLKLKLVEGEIGLMPAGESPPAAPAAAPSGPRPGQEGQSAAAAKSNEPRPVEPPKPEEPKAEQAKPEPSTESKP